MLLASYRNRSTLSAKLSFLRVFLGPWPALQTCMCAFATSTNARQYTTDSTLATQSTSMCESLPVSRKPLSNASAHGRHSTMPTAILRNVAVLWTSSCVKADPRLIR